MTEAVLDVRGLPKAEAYQQLDTQCRAVLSGIHDPVTGMATISCLLREGFGHLWVGFYRVVSSGSLLRIGPYQGSLGCLEIPLGSGVCGTAAAQRRTVIVPDVSRFPGHIVCDARARSEIVVPVFARHGQLSAVLDIDSETADAFDDDDARGLEGLMTWFTTSADAS